MRTADRPEAYLRRILTNTYISSVRPKSRRLELLTDSPSERGGVPPGIEERASMWPRIVALPPRQRTVVVLLTLPIGWGFAVETWSWETADTLVSRAVTADGFSRMVRCGVSAGKCVLLD